VKTNLTDVELNQGQEETYALWVTNNVDYGINVSVSVLGTIKDFITFKTNFFGVEPEEEKIIPIYVSIPSDAEPGKYTGEIVITGNGKSKSLPITITVSTKGTAYLDVIVESMNKRVGLNETAKFHVWLYNLGLRKKLNISLRYLVKDFKTEEVIYEESEKRLIETTQSFVKRISISDTGIPVGRYFFEVEVKYDSKTISAIDDFEVVKSFWTSENIRKVSIAVLAIAMIVSILYVRKRYIIWKTLKARYIFPINLKKLPKGRIWLGKIAETNIKAYFKMDELKTHVLTAGATGAGKTVSAMIFVEELLKEKIPVIVFDPTAQWTGFVRPCRDPNLLKYYKEFGMDRRNAKPYTGMIYEVTDPNVKIDFDKYMNPGEITVFTLNKLKPGEYDDAVRNIIDTIFVFSYMVGKNPLN
jgi:hypothetical protein